ncbi:MAG: hypothetical protein E7361_03000 [Clostridiales bacterium]|nr:hypothetical protein [Clostridiales bacterium]
MSLFETIMYLKSKPKTSEIDKIIKSRYLSDQKTSGIVGAIKVVSSDFDYKKNNLVMLIEDFTKAEEHRDNDYNRLLKRCKNIDYVSDIREEDGRLIIDTDNEMIKVRPMTDVFDCNEEGKDRLLSNRRYGHCHWDAIHIAEDVLEENNDKWCVATSMLNPVSKKMRFLHSWVELDQGDKVLCIDFTRNLIMNRDVYYSFYDVDKDVSRVSAGTIKQDIDLIEYGCDKHYCFVKFYLDDRDNAVAMLKDEMKMEKSALEM